jgi:hypothetical protein
MKKAGITDAFSGSGTVLQQANNQGRLSDQQMGLPLLPLDSIVQELLQKEQELMMREDIVAQQEAQIQQAQAMMGQMGQMYQQQYGVSPAGDVLPEGYDSGAPPMETAPDDEGLGEDSAGPVPEGQGDQQQPYGEADQGLPPDMAGGPPGAMAGPDPGQIEPPQQVGGEPGVAGAPADLQQGDEGIAPVGAEEQEPSLDGGAPAPADLGQPPAGPDQGAVVPASQGATIMVPLPTLQLSVKFADRRARIDRIYNEAVADFFRVGT